MMRLLAVGAALLLLATTLPGGLGTPPFPSEGLRLESNHGLARWALPDAGFRGPLQDLPASIASGSVAFVDRDHRNAVSQQVVLAGDGSAAWASWWLNNERVSKYDPASGRLWEQSGKPYGIVHGLGASGDGSLATAALPYTGPGAAQLGLLGATTVTLAGWPLGTGPAPLHTRFQAPCCSVFTDVSASGLVAVASHMAQTGPGDIGVLTLYGPGPTMLPLGSTTFSDDMNPSAGAFRALQGVDISDDGSVVVVTTYATVFVFGVSVSTLLATPSAVLPNNSQTVARVNDVGGALVVGGFNGQVHLYTAQTDGSFTKTWSRDVGHPWVTAVAVTHDHRVVAGTFDYRGGNAGKVAAFSIEGDLMWECLCYGDYVDDVQVTPDGNRAAAVSWGDFFGASGDVLTVFDMDGGKVLFRLLDDVDEPGSLHTVAISDDGKTVVAGGKAVHAREFGNGGMVYSIALS